MQTDKPQERIIRAANHLFYYKGYHATDIGDILKEANAHKASFYKHFGGKDALGEIYLNSQLEFIRRKTQKIMRTTFNLEDCLKKWSDFLVYRAKRGSFCGCPIGKFSMEVAGHPELGPKSRAALEEWGAVFTRYVRNLQRNSLIDPNLAADRAGDRIVCILQGACLMYAVTENIKYLEEIPLLLNKDALFGDSMADSI